MTERILMVFVCCVACSSFGLYISAFALGEVRSILGAGIALVVTGCLSIYSCWIAYRMFTGKRI